MQENWRLFCKGDEFKILSNKTDYLIMLAACIVPLVYIVDAAFNRLWLWSVMPCLIVTVIIIFDPTGFLVLFFNVGAAVVYYKDKPRMVMEKMANRGWKLHAWSYKKRRNEAIDEWIASRAIVPK